MATSVATSSVSTQVLSQADGYGIIVGLSVAFALLIILCVKMQKRYLSEDSDESEMFMVANRSVSAGLVCSAVFSSWMWINESVFCAAYTYLWGVSLPIWWASGLSFQIALMALLGIVAKLRVPFVHTSLEFIRVRYGGIAHKIFILLNLVNNVFGCGTMILSGAQLVTGMTGMNIIAVSILIPAGVVLYVVVGGLKATFLTDYLHTTIALILLTYFSIAALVNENVGGVSGLYQKVLATNDYVPGNYEGSLLSFKSAPAIYFGLVLKFGNLALVLMDTAFWQKSFAAEVGATVPAYDLASVAILAIPWCTGTIIGLTARAIEKTPVWYLYPQTLTPTQVNQGLVMPMVLISLLGKGATRGLLVLIFMAITSTVSSSMIAVSSIISQDFYRTYINPKAGDRKILRVSHWGVIFHGTFMAGFALMLNYAGATNNWSNYFRPIVACPGILPMCLTLLWSRQTKLAAILSPILGLISGLTVWLSLSWYWTGAINIVTTQTQLPGLYGAITSFFSPALYSVIISLSIKPYVFDWREFLLIGLIGDHSSTSTPKNASTVDVIVDGEKAYSPPEKTFGTEAVSAAQQHSTAQETKDELDIKERAVSERKDSQPSSSGVGTLTTSVLNLDTVVHPFPPEVIARVKLWIKYAAIFLVVNILVTIVLWPLPLYRDWIFTQSFFDGWVTMALVWQFFAIGTVVVWPIFDGRHSILKVFRGIGNDRKARNKH